jgi:hypothetical protein
MIRERIATFWQLLWPQRSVIVDGPGEIRALDGRR